MDAHESLVGGLTEGYTETSNAASAAALAIDLCIYIGAVAVAVMAEPVWMRLAAVIVAGTATSTLFILGHDAAHKSLFTNRFANAFFARLVFLPCLHNYTLWVIQHNRIHHQSTNVRRLNSFSPLSVTEYRLLPRWRRLLEKLYRSAAGFGVYYLVERWWKDKFFPRNTTPRAKRRNAWWDFSLLCLWLVVLCIGLVGLAVIAGQPLPALAIVWGFVLPFCVWNALMGLTAYLQHTNPRLPWFRSLAEARAERSQGELATHVIYPRWYDVLSHNIMWHPAHHANPRIPWFRLRRAQMRLNELLGERVVVERMTPGYVLRLTRTCQLYDYDARQWLDFSGRPTTSSVSEDRTQATPLTAG